MANSRRPRTVATFGLAQASIAKGRPNNLCMWHEARRPINI